MISIIIRTYNEAKFLNKSLGFVSQQEIDEDYELIIVDSGSTDETLDIAKSYTKNIIPIKKEDFSFGRSLNYGCTVAKGKILVFISAHCIPYNRMWLKNLVEPLKNLDVVLCYGRQIGNELSKFSENQVFAKYFPEEKKDEQGGFYCNNANSAIKKEFWEKRQFDENLTGLEDMDWAKYFYNQGYKIVYCPESIIYHIHEESWRKVLIRYEREAYALKEIMPEIHFNILDMIRAIFKGLFNDIKSGFKKGIFIGKLPEIFLFRICQFYGAYRGNHIHRKLSKEKKQNYFYP